MLRNSGERKSIFKYIIEVVRKKKKSLEHKKLKQWKTHTLTLQYGAQQD